MNAFSENEQHNEHYRKNTARSDNERPLSIHDHENMNNKQKSSAYRMPEFVSMSQRMMSKHDHLELSKKACQNLNFEATPNLSNDLNRFDIKDEYKFRYSGANEVLDQLYKTLNNRNILAALEKKEDTSKNDPKVIVSENKINHIVQEMNGKFSDMQLNTANAVL